jgi:NitT/TauT family transport system substrate-binding protein
MTTVIDAQGNFLDVVSEVTSGNAQFGVADAGQIMLAREQGQPVVAVAVIYQRHPLALTSLAEKGITAPEDLVGRNVHVTPQSRTILDALLAARDIDPATVNIVERTDLTTAVLLSGEADVIDAWITNEVVALINEGVEYNTIFAYDYGVDMYPNVIFTTEDYIANNRDVVLRFLRATLKGIEEAVGNPATAAQEAVKRDPTLNVAVEEQAIVLAVPLLIPQASRAGMMTTENWTTAHNILVSEGVLDDSVDVTQTYTLDFLNEIYGGS